MVMMATETNLSLHARRMDECRKALGWLEAAMIEEQDVNGGATFWMEELRERVKQVERRMVRIQRTINAIHDDNVG